MLLIFKRKKEYYCFIDFLKFFIVILKIIYFYLTLSTLNTTPVTFPLSSRIGTPLTDITFLS